MSLDFHTSISKRKKYIVGVFNDTHISMAITLLFRIIMLSEEEYFKIRKL